MESIKHNKLKYGTGKMGMCPGPHKGPAAKPEENPIFHAFPAKASKINL